jgi:hypothetical protein
LASERKKPSIPYLWLDHSKKFRSRGFRYRSENTGSCFEGNPKVMEADSVEKKGEEEGEEERALFLL